MKTNQSNKCQVPSGMKARLARADHSCHVSRVACHASAFTLVELLTVIAIIAVIAALLLPVASAVKRKSYIQTAQAQMAQMETAIESYKAAYGFYPPDNHQTPADPLVNQLYYELVGTTNTFAGNPEYEVLGGSSQQLSGGPVGDVKKVFGVTGFMNCAKSGADASATRAQDFLPGLKPDQYYSNFTNNNVRITLLVNPTGGPDPSYDPIKEFSSKLGLQSSAPGVNPWRYNSSSPTNNPGSYDLWMQLQISGKKYLICNWNQQVQINSPLP